jgi:hypothetical protein
MPSARVNLQQVQHHPRRALEELSHARILYKPSMRHQHLQNRALQLFMFSQRAEHVLGHTRKLLAA